MDSVKSECATLRTENNALLVKVSKLEARVDMLESEEMEDEGEDAAEEDGGCEIEVLRGGDDRIRSLKVRYTK
jgi:hypothetical protein